MHKTWLLVVCCFGGGHASLLSDASLQKTVKVRLLWVRHGQSCANVMETCTVKPPESNALLPDLIPALRNYPGNSWATATLSKNFGVQGASSTEHDCTVEIEGGGLVPGRRGADGAVVRAHDLYRDPTLTDCARVQSKYAGRALFNWMRSYGVKLDFIGSSFLLRAFETASAMFIAPCRESDCAAAIPRNLKVTPVPYIVERAPQGQTAAQADNLPMAVDRQMEVMKSIYGRALATDMRYARRYPRNAQQYDKFKAFLAVEIVPRIGDGIPWAVTDTTALMGVLEGFFPDTVSPTKLRNSSVQFSWVSGSYSNGQGFTKAEYSALEAPEVTVAIVGHNQMMKEYCLHDEPPAPNNNAVFEKLFVVDVSKADALPTTTPHFTLSELSEKCAKVMDAPSGQDSMSMLTQQDVATCTSPYNVSKFIGLDRSDANKGPRCVPLAATPDAYPIQSDFLQALSQDLRSVSPLTRPASKAALPLPPPQQTMFPYTGLFMSIFYSLIAGLIIGLCAPYMPENSEAGVKGGQRRTRAASFYGE